MKKTRIIKPLLIIVFIFGGAMLIYFSDIFKSGIKDGLNIAANTIIPSLFPFICFSNIALGIFSGSANKNIFGRIYSRIFSLPSSTLKVLIFSLIGGYPIGPMMSAHMLSDGEISEDDAKRLMLFCCNSGPAFSVIAVGMNLCGNRKEGAFLCISTTLSALITGIILGRFKKKSSECKAKLHYRENRDFSEILNSSVEKSTYAIIKICAWIIIFNMICKLILSFNMSNSLSNIIDGILEVTAGCSANKNSPIMLASILGFGGISVFFQVSEFLNKAKVKFYEFFAARIFISALSSAICAVLIQISPISVTVFANGASFALSYRSLPFSAVLIFSMAVFILDKKILPFNKTE